MNIVELHEMIDGGLQEQFGKSFEKVIENLQDPNTPYKNARKITIELKFTQNERRNDVKCSVSVKETLAPRETLETAFAVGKDLKTGELYAEEYGKQIRGQMHIDDMPDFDEETGEIHEEQPLKPQVSEVVDFRKAR